MRRVVLLVVAGIAFALAACGREPADRAPLVLAAASLQESMNEAADAWAAMGHRRPVVSFAASSTLARQIENGAEADLFVSADREWVDSVERAGRIRPGTRHNLLGNVLVMIAPTSGPEAIAPEPGGLTRALGDGRLAMADPDAVPAGRYGKAALQSLDLWGGIENRIARAENVRAALALVERGEAPLGIVYATDARASRDVRIVARFPASSNPPIVYPIALLAGAQQESEAFQRFLLSAEGQAIFARHGFTPPPAD